LQPIRAKTSCDLGTGLFPWIYSHDIQLALDDGVFEAAAYPATLQLEPLSAAEALQYHRQLFFWRLHPLLWALSRTATSNATLQSPRLARQEIKN
jgi:hypothetical protein